MFYVGGVIEVTLTLPYPWIIQGAMPIHMYDDVDFTTNDHQDNLSDAHTQGARCVPQRILTLASYTDTNGDEVVGFGDTYTADVWIPETGDLNGFYYVNIALDYGLKDTTYWAKGTLNQAISTPTNSCSYWISLPDHLRSAELHFQRWRGHGEYRDHQQQYLQEDQGIGGLVYTVGGAPVPEGTVVTISVTTGKNPQTVKSKLIKMAGTCGRTSGPANQQSSLSQYQGSNRRRYG